MNQFYCSEISNGVATLSPSESQHLRVLRIKEGASVLIVDGKGGQYLGELTQLHKKASVVMINETMRTEAAPPLLDIAIAPTKSIDRFEYFLEKATEIGVRNIFPFTSYHSERKVIKTERLEKIILSAMKQSLRLWLPQLHPLTSFKSLVESQRQRDVAKYIAHLKTNQFHLKDLVESNSPTLVVVGPEGGFSNEEIKLAETTGLKSVTLGRHRLRTETAGVVAASIFANS